MSGRLTAACFAALLLGGCVTPERRLTVTAPWPPVTPWPAGPAEIADARAAFDAISAELSAITPENAQRLYGLSLEACSAGVADACAALQRLVEPATLPAPKTLHTIAAAEADARGDVEYECRLLAGGSLEDCRVLLSMPGMDASVLRYLQQAAAAPTTFGGVTVDATIRFLMKFSSAGASAERTEAQKRAAFHPDDPHALRHLAVAWTDTGRAPEESCPLVERASRVMGDDPTLLIYRARCKLMSHQPNEALASAVAAARMIKAHPALRQKAFMTLALTSALLRRCEDA